jgi:hypothetical protein
VAAVPDNMDVDSTDINPTKRKAPDEPLEDLDNKKARIG